MHVITATRLRDFWRTYPDAEGPLRAWIQIIEAKSYRNPNEVRRDFAAASFLGDRRTVFNIAGNKYRLVVDIRYDLGRVYVRHVVTHQRYDELTRRGEL